jgi:hypothetical protein
MVTLIRHLYQAPMSDAETVDKYPSLVHKCYSPANLKKLDFIRETILRLDCSEAERDFFLLALADTLRTASKAGAGWPYIAPSKYHEKQERDAIETFSSAVGEALSPACPKPFAAC